MRAADRRPVVGAVAVAASASVRSATLAALGRVGRDSAGRRRRGAPARRAGRDLRVSPARERSAKMRAPTAPGTPRMQRLLLLIVLVAAAAFAYLHWFAAPAPRYSLAAIERQPVPRAEFFALWREAAYDLCAPGRSGSERVGAAACRAHVERAHERCVARAGAGAPATIADQAESRRWARPYLDCVLPAPAACGGVPVRSDEDARRHCPP